MQKCLEIQHGATPPTRRERFFGKDPLVPEARSWFKGALGERAVAVALEQLGPEWTVLHAVPVGTGQSDIDHVVIGPGGVFTVNTKNHAGQKVFVGGGSFMVSGYRQPHMRNALHEAERAERLLSVAAGVQVRVQPLLILAAAASFKVGRKTPMVVTLQAHQVGRWFHGLRRVKSAEEVRFLSMLAEERGTWHVESLVITDTLRHVQRFERLEREVIAAAGRRRFVRQVSVLGVLAVPAACLLGYWWAIAVSALHG
ncbi:nuclease-related domain-containing protein [Curtobacterium sp. MCBD17_028]|uniref:nuclease-related domain-containing protein n=1 Tax=Curtobacterium sp. MCBD17_028 TaxID=2175670 RepID=UPI000DA82C2C|nr:nuclease-related domain-containing protein [Curtobacterium sp. MCBD17_028]PZE30185.1 NERD domain-containing protein [Curtobacterium sp. MCBD17_028]